MTATVQVTFDCADPHVMACFWAAALGYEKESHVALVKELLDSKRITPADVKEVDGGLQFADVSACRDPESVGPRPFFQRVPESARRTGSIWTFTSDPNGTSPRLPDSSHWGPSGCRFTTIVVLGAGPWPTRRQTSSAWTESVPGAEAPRRRRQQGGARKRDISARGVSWRYLEAG